MNSPSSSQTTEDIARVFNTALVSSKADSSRDFGAELVKLMDTPAYQALLTAVRTLAASQGISERAAAEQVITTFRQVDRIWSDYLVQEGIDRMRGSAHSN